MSTVAKQDSPQDSVQRDPRRWTGALLRKNLGVASLVTALLAAALLPRTAPSAGVAPAPGDARE
ncbi:hypothetical protein [Streptomyces sp. NPDC059262]|uniref:hypothetical protein n=1 Tax=Streptomyces sp. NPDC059262 TaxID=3346797 RepID=UPI0036BF05E1